VAIVNRRFAQKHYAAASPIGRRIRLTPSDSSSRWRTIVGVVGDIEQRPLISPDPGMVYAPLAQTADGDVNITVRGTGNALVLAPLTADAVRSLDPEITVVSAARLDALLAHESTTERLFGGLFLFFGLAALLLASVGLGGLVALSVQQTRRELGIRIALGARMAAVAGLVLRGGLRQLLLGLTVGLALAVPLARLLGEALMGADVADWRAYVAAGLVLLIAGASAAWIPTRRALRIAPAEVLRLE
jgi:putative ABC transport system permease protein